MFLVIDFETKSELDLKKVGGMRYASDPSTDILCLCAYDTTTGEKFSWDALDTPPLELFEAFKHAPFIAAVNAAFDQAIYEYIAVADYGFPLIPSSKWYCIQAQLAVNALPQKLEHAARALHTHRKKNPAGTRLITRMSKPPFEDTPELRKEMMQYCMDDVLASVEVMKACRLMTEQEHQDWLLNEQINLRGVMIDRDLAFLAVEYADIEKLEIAGKLATLTKGRITASTQSVRLRDLLLERIPEKDHKLLKRGTKYTADKSTRETLLADYTDLAPDLREILELFNLASASSVSKFQAMLNAADPYTNRIYGVYTYYGASQSGRYTSRLIQLHNLARDCFKPDEAEAVKSAMLCGDEIPNVMETLKKLIRPAVIPAHDYMFGVCDWSAIEARVLPWLAGTHSAKKAVLDVFEKGEDIYVTTAAKMGTRYTRQIGKVAVLALGFQGGVNAFNSMAVNYGVHLSDAEAQQIVDDWREANGWAVRFWSGLNEAVIQALRQPNKEIIIGRLMYQYLPNLANGTLVCHLPDGSMLQYPHARLEQQTTPWGDIKPVVTYAKAALTIGKDQVNWPRASLYGGLLAENATQGTAAALLRHALREAEDAGLYVVGHTHDEIIIESHIKKAQNDFSQLEKIMKSRPCWAADLPLDAEGGLMSRYGK